MSVRIFDIRGRTLKKDNPPLFHPIHMPPFLTSPLINRNRNERVLGKKRDFYHQKSQLGINKVGNDPLHYGMESGIDYDSPPKTQVIRHRDEKGGYKEGLKGVPSTRSYSTAKGRAKLQARIDRGDFKVKKKRPPPIDMKKPHRVIKKYVSDLPNNPTAEVKRPKYKKEIRTHKIAVVNPETNESYPTTEPKDDLDLTKFRKGDFKTFNPRHIAHSSVGMGDMERDRDETDDQYLGHNLVQYPTTTTGGEGWVERNGRLEHSNPLIGSGIGMSSKGTPLNEETIVGQTLDKGDDPRVKPRTWEGKDRMGMSKVDKLKEKPKTLAKVLKKYGAQHSTLIDADVIERVGHDLTYEPNQYSALEGVPIDDDNSRAMRALPQPRYKYRGDKIITTNKRTGETKPLGDLMITHMNRGYDVENVMEQTKSEFYYFKGSQKGNQHYSTTDDSAKVAEQREDDNPYTIPRKGGNYDRTGKETTQEEIDAYLSRGGSKARFSKHYGKRNIPIQGSNVGAMNAPRTYKMEGGEYKWGGFIIPYDGGDLEGRSVMIPKQKDEPLSFNLRGKDYDATYKGFERDNREMVEELIGEEKQETLMIEPEDLSMTQGAKFDINWDTQERGVVRGDLTNKKLFKDKDLKEIAMTKGIAVEARSRGEDKGRGGMYDMFRGNKGKTSKGQKGEVRKGIMRTKWDTTDGKGREVLYRPTTQNPTAVMKKIITAPLYKRAQAPRELLLEKLKIGNPDAFTLEDTSQNVGQAPSSGEFEENFLSSEVVVSEDDLTDDGGDYAIANYEEF